MKFDDPTHSNDVRNPTIVSQVRVETMAISKRKWEELDVVPSFSDSDEIPDLDGEDAPDEDERPKPKANKRSRRQKPEPDEDDEESKTWTSKGHDDGAFDPDFHFDDDAEGIVEQVRDFDLPSSERSKQVDLDEIIRRRRAKQGDAYPSLEVTSANGAIEPSEDEPEEEDEIDGPIEARTSQKHIHEGTDGSDDDYEGKEGDEISAPMPDVDGYESEEENDVERAKRDAFFAPEENKPNDLKAHSKAGGSFLSMSLSRPILRGLTSVGFTAPTPIQSKAVPVALLGKDIVGGAVTGSGKTAAFLLPILERLLYRPKKIASTRVSILLPTRELAVQCYNVAKKLAQFTDISFALIVGGLSLREQEQTLKKRPDIIIATPGRFIDHMRNTASFVVENLEILVLDEADRMLEEGFSDELNEVLNTIPRSRQTMLFSATMTQDIDKLIRVGMNKPVRLMVDSKQQTVSGLVQEFIKLKYDSSETEDVIEHKRLATLLHLCKVVYPTQTIVFIPTKSLAHRLKILFALQGIKASELHGSMSQEQRLSAITSFRNGESTHLLATDLASRGLDIPRVETVINYSVPTTKETYLHRVGRTARAGRSGTSCTLFSAVKATSNSKGSSKVSERALLKPILKLAKTQKAPMRTRTLPAHAIDSLSSVIGGLDDEIDGIMKEEKEERLLAQTERDVVKSENLIQHEEEIMSRPRRTWFQSESDKKIAKDSGKESRMGLIEGGEAGGSKKIKRKLSGKEKKRLDAKDIRKSSQGWKKRKDGRHKG